MKIAVVILNWNGKKILEEFLPKVVSHSADLARVIVADNASTDDSVHFVKSHFPEVQVLVNASNRGFAGGYNDALLHINAEYYVLLNSDVEVTAGWIQPIIDLMDADSSIAACQPKIRSYRNKKQFEYAGAAGGFIDRLGYPFCRGRIFNSFEEDRGQYNDTKEIFWATGACLFVRAGLFHKAGGLDEDFFAHMEEIDLCWRMKNMGYRIMYCPASTVYHVGGGTLASTSPQKTFLNFRNNLLLLWKNSSPGAFLGRMLLRFLLDGVAGLKFFFSGDMSHAFAVVKAHFSFYGQWGKTRNKRKTLRKNVTAYSRTGIYRGSIVLDYFLKGKKYFYELDRDRF